MSHASTIANISTMGSIKKARQGPLRRAPLREVILSSFSGVVPQIREQRLCHARSPPALSGKAKQHGAGVLLLQNLTCISSECGLRAIVAVKRAVLNYVLSEKDVAQSLGDEYDAAPSLCNLLYLLDERVLCFADISSHSVVQRIKHTLESQHGCACENFANIVLRRFVESVLARGVDAAANAFLGRLMCPVVLGSGSCSSWEPAKSFTFSAKVVEVLREHSANSSYPMTLFVAWIRQSVRLKDNELLTGNDNSVSTVRRILQASILDPVAIHSPCRRFVVCFNRMTALLLILCCLCQVTLQWPRFLSGVACGKDVTNFLACDGAEEACLHCLYGAVGPDVACGIVVDVLKSASVAVSSDSASRGLSPQEVNWPRLFFLMARACDLKEWSDVKGTERPAVELCLLAMAASSLCFDKVLLCAIIAISRYFCRCGRNANSADDVERGFRDHDKFLHRLIECASERMLRLLVDCLRGLIPVDDKRFLRSCVKVFSRQNRFQAVFQRYVNDAQSRLASLISSGGDQYLISCDDVQKHGETRTRKVGDDITRFISEFMRTGGVVPCSLVRQMNFHRYHFRQSTVVELLSPHFVPPESALKNEFPHGGARSFNEQRIKLIKTIAFGRMDSAITRAEAEAAVKAISEVMELGMRTRNNVATERQHVLPGNSSFDMLLNALCRAGMQANSVSGVQENAHANTKKIFDLLMTKLVAAERNAGSDLAATVAEFLHALLCAIVESRLDCSGSDSSDNFCGSIRDSIHSVLMNAFSDNSEHPSSDPCARLLSRNVTWVRLIVVEVVSDCRLTRFRRLLQARFLSLLALQVDQLEFAYIAALSVFIFAVNTVSESSLLYDFTLVVRSMPCVRIQQLLDAVVDGLPLKTPLQILRSFQFCAFYFILAQRDIRFGNVPDAVHAKASYSQVHLITMAKHVVQCKDVEEVVPCSQPTAENEAAMEGSEFHDGGSNLHTAERAIAFLRWVLTTPRRITEFKGDIMRNLRRPVGACVTEQSSSVKAEDAKFEVEWLLLSRLILNELHEAPFSAGSTSLGEWIQLESRVGWGFVDDAMSALLKHTKTRSCPCVCLSSLLPLLATLVHDARFSADSQSGSNPLWIVVAAQKLATEAELHHSLVAPWQPGESRRYPSLSPAKRTDHEFFFEGAEKLFAQKRSEISASHVMQLSSFFPASLYFGAASCRKVASHIAQYLIPRLWPISCTSARNLLAVYMHWQSRQSSDLDIASIPIGVVVAAARHWRNLHSFSPVESFLVPQNSHPVFTCARVVSRMLEDNSLTTSASHKTYNVWSAKCFQDGSSSGFERLNDIIAYEFNVVAFGICLVSCACDQVGSFQSDVAKRPGERLARNLHEAICSSNLDAVEVLGVAIDVSAYCPLLGSNPSSTIDAQSRVSGSISILSEFIETRVWLPRTTTPDFLFEHFYSHLPSWVTKARKELGILAYLQATTNFNNAHEPVAVLTWTASCADCESFLNLFVLAQIAASVGALKDATLQRVRQILDNGAECQLALSMTNVYIECFSLVNKNYADQTLGHSRCDMLSAAMKSIENALCRLAAMSIYEIDASSTYSRLAQINAGFWSRLRKARRVVKI